MLRAMKPGSPPPDDPSPGASLLARFLEPEVDLDAAFDDLLSRADKAGLGRTETHAPPAALAPPALAPPSGGENPDVSAFLGSVLAEYDEIERLLGALDERKTPASGSGHSDAVAFVSEAELADPDLLQRALEPLQTHSAKFHFLFAQARYALDRLDVYGISRLKPERLIEILRQEENLRLVQSLVEFLRHLQLAADSFEALELPRPHIRDYLRHLYQMRDWREMARLVDRLESSVGKLQSPAKTAP